MQQDRFFEMLREPCPVPAGVRIELVHTSDPYTELRPGDRGTVTGGNGAQIHVAWTTGSNLSLVVGEDSWRVVGSAD